MLWVLKRDGSFEHPKPMLKLMGKNILKFLRSKILYPHVLVEKLERLIFNYALLSGGLLHLH